MGKKRKKLVKFITSEKVRENKFLKYSPSLVATSCVILAFDNLNIENWNEEVRNLMGYLESDTHECIKNLKKTYQDIRDIEDEHLAEYFKLSRV